MHTRTSLYLRFGMGAAIALGAALMSGGCLDTADGSAATEQELGTPHGMLDIRSQYAITSTGSLSRTIAIVGVKRNATLQADLNLQRAAAGLAPTTIQEFNQLGATSPLPGLDAVSGRQESIALQTAAAPCESCNFLIFEANSSSSSDIAATFSKALTMLPANSILLPAFELAETDAAVPGMQAAIVAHPGVLVVASADKIGTVASYPGSSPNAIQVAGTEFSTTPGIDLATSVTGDQCSTVFSRPAFQPSGLCPGTQRNGADVAAVARDLKVYDAGSAITLDSVIGSAGVWAGRIGLSVGALPTPAQVYAASPTFRSDVPSGMDAFGHVAVVGTDLASGLGTPKGNQTF